MRVPQTAIRTSHALAIRTAQGRVIGAVHGWAETQTREVAEEFTVRPDNYDGLPEALVPQNITGRTLRVSRYDLFRSLMEEAFGEANAVLLTDEANAFDLVETWSTATSGLNLAGRLFGDDNVGLVTNLVPNLIEGGPARAFATTPLDNPLGDTQTALAFIRDLGARPRRYKYSGCRFTDLGRTADAKGDRAINVEATIVWRKKEKIR